MAEATALASPQAAAAEPRQERRQAPRVSIEVPQEELAEADHPPQRTFEEVFRQSGLAWQAYFAIFLSEFVVASSWTTYCVITLYNVTDETCEAENQFWPIILLLCSMKFSGPWFETWSQNFIRNQTIQGATRTEPNILTYRKTMTKYRFIRSQLMGWTLLSTFMMALVWFGIGSLGAIHNYAVESALHIPLGVFASGTLMLFRALCKHIYWNNFPTATYDSIAQTAKATSLIVHSLGFIRATEYYYDLSSVRMMTVFLLLNMVATVLMINSGNHFAKPPSSINRSTPVQMTLPPRSPSLPSTPPSGPSQPLPATPQGPTPTRRLQSPKRTLSKFGDIRRSYDDRMSNQKYERLEDLLSTGSPNRTNIVVDVEVHESPDDKSQRRQSPRQESMSGTRETTSEQRPDDIRSGNVESSSRTRSQSKDRIVEGEEEIKSVNVEDHPRSSSCSQLTVPSRSESAGVIKEDLRPSLEGTGAIRKRTLQIHKSPKSSSRRGLPETRTSEQPVDTQLPSSSGGDLRSQSNSNVTKTMDKEECDDIQKQIKTMYTSLPSFSRASTASLRHATVSFDKNLQQVKFQKQGKERRASLRFIDNSSQQPDLIPSTGTTTSKSSSRRNTSFASKIKRFFSTTAIESVPSIPAVNFSPASPTTFTPRVGQQDQHYLTVEEKTGPRRLRGPRNPDPNQICIDPEPEPRRLDTSALHAYYETKENMVDDLAESVQILVISLRRSCKDVWFWYTIVSTAMVNLISVLFLVACPHLALFDGDEDLIQAAEALVWIALPWLLLSIILGWPLQKYQKEEIMLFKLGVSFHTVGLFLTSIGIFLRLIEFSTIFSGLMFGIGFGFMVNSRKTTHQFFCICNDGLYNNVDHALTRNTDVGTGMAWILFYLIYHSCMNTGDLSVGLSYFMGTWAVCGLIAAFVKKCTL